MLAPSVAAAQVLSCTVPARIATPRPDLPDQRTPRRVVPIASYTLAISWAPQFCREAAGRADTAQQCGRGQRFGFTLHGLWPDGPGKDWPQYCRPVALLGEATLRANLCATPSAQLIQHEWAKHGSCTGETPDRYFARSRHLYQALRFPDMAALASTSLTARRLADAFARANAGMTADSMRVTADRDGWLQELWLCLDRRYRSVACPGHQGGLAPSAPLKIHTDARQG